MYYTLYLIVRNHNTVVVGCVAVRIHDTHSLLRSVPVSRRRRHKFIQLSTLRQFGRVTAAAATAGLSISATI